MNNEEYLSIIFCGDYDRICEGHHLNMINKPFTKQYITQMEEFFKNLEEYEKCEVIKAYHQSRFPYGILWTLT